MRILYKNYLEDSTLSATSEDSLYPVENLTHKFLEKKFQAEGNLSTVTVLFPEDRTVNMIAYGFNNLETSADTIKLTKGASDTIKLTKGASDTIKLTISAQWELKDSGGSSVASGVIAVGQDVNVIYPGSITARSLEITFATSGENAVYVGSLSVGEYLEYEYTQVNPVITDQLRADVSKTNGGQLIGNQSPDLREWQVVVPNMDNDKRLETRTMVNTVGSFKPIFVDLWEDADYEEPMHGNITQAGTYRRDSRNNEYTMGLTIEEAR